jgi:hypothetical protein
MCFDMLWCGKKEEYTLTLMLNPSRCTFCTLWSHNNNLSLQAVNDWLLHGTRNTMHWRSANVILGWEMVTDRKDWKGNSTVCCFVFV